MEFNKALSRASETTYMLNKQLKILLKQHSISVTKLSKDTSINAKTLYNYLDGRTPRNLKHVRQLCEYFKVSADFLLFGIEETASLKTTNVDDLVQLGRFDVYLKRIEK